MISHAGRTPSSSTARYELQPGSGGTTTLRLSGRLDAASTAGLWRELDAKLHSAPVATLDVDASGVDYCDGAGIALLHFLGMGGMSPKNGTTTVRGLQPELESLPEILRRGLQTEEPVPAAAGEKSRCRRCRQNLGGAGA